MNSYLIDVTLSDFLYTCSRSSGKSLLLLQLETLPVGVDHGDFVGNIKDGDE